MKTALIVWIVASTLTCHAVLTDSRSVLSVPPMSAAPVVDSCVSVREWTDAALLPALGRLPGGASDRRDTKVYVGWQGEQLYLAVVSPHAPQATADVTGQESQPDQEANFVELTLKLAGGETRRLRLSGRGGEWLTGKADGFQGRGRATVAGWEAETKIPFALLGGLGEYELEAVLHEPSLGLVSPPLKQRLIVGDLPVACRFTEAGEFRGGSGRARSWK